jgi:hypothetical protein
VHPAAQAAGKQLLANVILALEVVLLLPQSVLHVHFLSRRIDDGVVRDIDFRDEERSQLLISAVLMGYLIQTDERTPGYWRGSDERRTKGTRCLIVGGGGDGSWATSMSKAERVQGDQHGGTHKFLRYESPRGATKIPDPNAAYNCRILCLSRLGVDRAHARPGIKLCGHASVTACLILCS